MTDVPRIKPINITEYEFKQSKYEHVLKLPFRSIIVASPTGGKTVLVQNLILNVYRNSFARIFIFSPSVHNDPTFTEVKKYIRDELHVDDEKEQILHIYIYIYIPCYPNQPDKGYPQKHTPCTSQDMVPPNEVSYNAVLGCQGNWQLALQILEDMRGSCPNLTRPSAEWLEWMCLTIGNPPKTAAFSIGFPLQ